MSEAGRYDAGSATDSVATDWNTFRFIKGVLDLTSPSNATAKRPSAHLTKSRFAAGDQCVLRLYNDVFHRELASPYSKATKARFEVGNRVGELARRRYSGGVLVGHEPWERDAALADTRRLMADPTVPAIYEAAIEHGGVFIRVDILVRRPDGWELVEVKSSTSLDKAPYRLDVAIQYWVLAGAGIRVLRAGILGLDRDYVYPGGEHDPQTLFCFADVTGHCREIQDELGGQVSAFQKILASDEAPDVPVGDHCFSPYGCPYYAHCTKGVVFPQDTIKDLPNLMGGRQAALVARGIDLIRDIPADFELTAMQERVRQAVVSGMPWQSPELAQALATAQQPIHYLDFETWSPALPEYPGTRPFQALPFQFSLHVEDSDGATKHIEFLHEERSDPRRPLAEALLQALGDSGSIVVYSSFEKTTVTNLARDLPDLADPLLALVDRLWDLRPIVRNHYYHPAFRGSFSIKDVLPAMLPGEGWADLEITGGGDAGLFYERGLATSDPETRKREFKALLDYCRQDSWAMVRLVQELRRLCR